MARRPRRAPTRRVVTQSQLPPEHLDALREACRFDADAPALGWAWQAVLRQDSHLRRHGLHGRPADLGLHYVIEPSPTISNRTRLHSLAHGHDADPVATSFVTEQRDGGPLSTTVRGESEWLDGIASHWIATQALVERGLPPRRPPASSVEAEPALARLIAHHGVSADALLLGTPRFGAMVVGRGWRKVSPMPRVVEVGDLRAHIERTAGRIRTIRLGLSDGVSYDPPDPMRARHAGILTINRTTLPEAVRRSLVGEPATRLVEHPVIIDAMRIRAVTQNAGALVVRVDHPETPQPLA